MKDGLLQDKIGVIFGLANDQSIAFGCVKIAALAGARLIVTCQDVKSEPYAKAALATLPTGNMPKLLVCDVQDPAATEAVFQTIATEYGRLDFLIHCIAYAPAPDLHGRVIDCSREGFLLAMDVSCHSFIRLGRLAEPLMGGGGSILTMSYYGGEKVIPDYNVMGPVKAALDAVMRELASELGDKNIRVNVIAPGPIPTRAAKGLANFSDMAQAVVEKSPQHRLVTIEEVGQLAAFLASDQARAITGTVTQLDAGYHIMA
jgi:enoyl-[acyl-carrier protein] reductase I